MVVLKFLDQNVFNVIKYVIMALTVSYASDVLLDALHTYRTARSLKQKGWAKPLSSSPYSRIRRGPRISRVTESAVLIMTAVLLTILEMAVEFSTGAEIVWIEKSTSLRVANRVTSLETLRNTDPRYMLRLRGALQRVENTCFSIEQKWFHPVVLNMSSASDFQALGHVAKCYENYTASIDATATIHESRFNASEFATMQYWPSDEIRIGRDVGNTDVMIGLNATADEVIGANEYYSFLAVNFTNPQEVEGSERRLTDHFTNGAKELGIYTLNYTVRNGQQIECLVKRWTKKQRKKHILEVCLLPLSNNRTALGLFDDYEDTKDYQLVLSVAFDGQRSFHDPEILKAMPWMLGTNNGMHSYRELAILVILCGLMLEGIGTEGFRTLEVTEGVRSITAPTLTIWGIVLLLAGTVAILIASLVLRRLKSGIGIRGDLATADGVASHWLAQLNELYDASAVEEKAMLLLEHGKRDQLHITVKAVGSGMV